MYSWVILAGCVAILCFGMGMGWYATIILLSPICAELGLSHSAYSLGSSLYMLLSLLGAPLVGVLLDRWGPRRVILGSAVLNGGAWLLISRIGQLGGAYLGQGTAMAQLFVLYSLAGLSAAGMGSVACAVLIARWFQRRQGLANGIANAGSSLPGLILVPLSAPFIAAHGWRALVALIGALTWGVCLPVALWVLRDSPPGAQAESPHFRLLGGAVAAKSLRTAPFWLISGAYLCSEFAQQGVSLHAISFLTGRGLTVAAASNTWGLLALSGIVGKLVLGHAADRVSPRIVSLASMLLSVIGLAAGLLWQSPAAPLFFALAFGLGMGGRLACRPLLVEAEFGLRALGTISGAVSLVTLPGVVLGGPLAGVLYDQTGSYGAAFRIFVGAFCLAAFLLSLSAWPRRTVATEP